MNVGRWIPEILRIVQALQVADENKASTPANWVPCNPVIVPIPKTFTAVQERNNSISESKNGMNWYLSFKEPQNCNLLEQIDEKNNNSKSKT